MSGPLDPKDEWWNTIKKDPDFKRGWNAALWEVRKAVEGDKVLKEYIDVLQRIVK